MKIKNKDLKRRIIQISYKHGLSHLGSCLTACDIINEIYETMNPLQYKTGWDERFILSSGHAGLALYVVLEKFGWGDAEEMFLKHGVHPNRDIAHGIYCSTGSLGQGLPIAVGMALANRKKRVFCLISDGECAEGSIHEAMRIKTEQYLENLKVYINVNGWSAYQKSNDGWIYHNYEYLADIRETENELPFLKDQDAHYLVMSEDQYNLAMEILK